MNEFKKSNLYFNYDHESKNEQLELFMSENSQKDITLKWFTDIEQIVVQDHQSKMTGKQLPFTVFVMNQYFDALPTMILEFTKDGWREKVLTLSKDPKYL